MPGTLESCWQLVVYSMWSQHEVATPSQQPGGVHTHPCVCAVRAACAGRRPFRQRCSAVRGVDVGRGYWRGCFAGSPWREAQQSLMLSTSEREGGDRGRKKDRDEEWKRKRLPVDQPTFNVGAGEVGWEQWWCWRARERGLWCRSRLEESTDHSGRNWGADVCSSRGWPEIFCSNTSYFSQEATEDVVAAPWISSGKRAN